MIHQSSRQKYHYAHY